MHYKYYALTQRQSCRSLQDTVCFRSLAVGTEERIRKDRDVESVEIQVMHGSSSGDVCARESDMRSGEQDEDTPTVTFPDDYPNSVRHFLLIGFLGMFIGAIVFFYMGISRKVNTVMHVLTFFIAAVSACAYYAEWAGLGVEYKTTDTTPRVIFWAHYLDWVITGPVSSRSQSAAHRSI